MLQDFYKNKKVLITGHTGFCGSWLSRFLLYLGADVCGYALFPHTKPALFDVLRLDGRVKSYFEDIRNLQKLKNVLAFEKPNIVFHLAAQPIVFDGYSKPQETFEVNTMGTVNVLEAIRQTKCAKAVVVVTTDKVYKNFHKGPVKEDNCLAGSCPYSASKAAAELVAKSYQQSFANDSGFSIATARAGNILGGGDWGSERLIPAIVKSFFEEKQKPVLRSPQSTRPWQFVLDAICGYLLLGEKLWPRQSDFSGAWNFGPEPENCVTVGELTKKSLGLLGESDYLITQAQFPKEEQLLVLDNQKAKNLLSWKPILSIDQILSFTFEWYIKFYQGQNMEAFTLSQIEFFYNKIKNNG